MNSVDLGSEDAPKFEKNTRRTYARNGMGRRSGRARRKPPADLRISA
ncbi:hypothetical protein J7E96_04560 [Streptomyces sp. ISL-96]|nr:hypothetical protein [Streptomyces sp. ISL-96]MBT2487814.1 hypothetical protein [Streptomyces sp. ISL-96]